MPQVKMVDLAQLVNGSLCSMDDLDADGRKMATSLRMATLIAMITADAHTKMRVNSVDFGVVTIVLDSNINVHGLVRLVKNNGFSFVWTPDDAFLSQKGEVTKCFRRG